MTNKTKTIAWLDTSRGSEKICFFVIWVNWLFTHLHKPIATITGLVNWLNLFVKHWLILCRHKEVEAALRESISLYHMKSCSQNPSPLHLFSAESCQLQLSNTTNTCTHYMEIHTNIHFQHHMYVNKIIFVTWWYKLSELHFSSNK